MVQGTVIKVDKATSIPKTETTPPGTTDMRARKPHTCTECMNLSYIIISIVCVSSRLLSHPSSESNNMGIGLGVGLGFGILVMSTVFIALIIVIYLLYKWVSRAHENSEWNLKVYAVLGLLLCTFSVVPS